MAGIFHCLMNERNMRTHFIAGILVFGAAIYFKLSGVEIAIVGLTVGLVITTELINTAIENTVDLVTMEYKPLAKIAKDVAAGAVLLAAFTAVLVGLALFVPKIMR
ncbi:MAG: diacylglycerol kinase family protein [Clostridia bacterium]|nr:diacylglycerol kinase family protein [Clostridia bacterium]